MVTGGDVDQGQQLDVGLAGDRGGLGEGPVPGFGGALDLLLGKAGVVDQQLGVGGSGDRRRRGSGVASEDDRAAQGVTVPSPAHRGAGPWGRPSTSSPLCSAANAGPSFGAGGRVAAGRGRTARGDPPRPGRSHRRERRGRPRRTGPRNRRRSTASPAASSISSRPKPSRPISGFRVPNSSFNPGSP